MRHRGPAAPAKPADGTTTTAETAASERASAAAARVSAARHPRCNFSLKELLCGIKRCSSVAMVNGQDLSQSSHHEAVEAFRAAKEPIVVEVLRRTTKGNSGGSGGGVGGSGGSGGGSSRVMKSRAPAMVSTGTQTEEEFYGFNLPTTPPPGLYAIPFPTGLYQPSSRRPVAFSPSAEMGLTDIEMAHSLDIDDPYFDDRQYEMVYEEVLLQRTSSDEKLGLTLCYGSLEDEMTDIFISEVDPCSIAGKDGRIREGDQIVQINGVDVRSRSEAISLFSGHGTDISLTVARAQLQCDDGFMEEPSLALNDLQLDLQHNMQFMASMLARHQFDEEGGTTDTATTENSNQHEKDSGVGRTDGSTRNDESSEQDTFDTESMSTLPPSYRMCHYNNDNYLSADLYAEFPTAKCQDSQGKQLGLFSQNNFLQGDNQVETENGSEREFTILNREMEEIQIECQNLQQENHVQEQQRVGVLGYEALLRGDTIRSPRIVPRMGTRLEYLKHQADLTTGRKPGTPTAGSPVHSVSNGSSNPGYCQISSPTSTSKNGSGVGHTSPSLVSTLSPSMRDGNSDAISKAGLTTGPSVRTYSDKDMWTTSAYNTAESCRSTPLTLELNPALSGEAAVPVGPPTLCLATPPSNIIATLVTSDTEKQTQTPTKPRDYSSEESCPGHPRGSSSSNTIKALSIPENPKVQQPQLGESLQDLYLHCADVMYTNQANLQHTIAVQQKLFQKQLDQQARLRGPIHSSSRHANTGVSTDVIEVNTSKNTPGGQTVPSDSGQMEWVVKRRPDGTRYITRRPVRNKLLKERAKKISEERSGLTTDDDAMSEMKTGRYWSKEDRKRHLEKAKDYKRKKEILAKARMETLKETEEKKEVNIVELSHRKMMKHKGKKVFDNFTTVKEMLAHGNKVSDGKTYNPLLSVTTV